MATGELKNLVITQTIKHPQVKTNLSAKVRSGSYCVSKALSNSGMLLKPPNPRCQLVWKALSSLFHAAFLLLGDHPGTIRGYEHQAQGICSSVAAYIHVENT